MLICTHCGKTYDGEVPTYLEIHGYTSMGNAMAETCVDTLCPHCKKGELVEATECKACGEYFYDESNYKVCDDCLDKNKTLETALAIGEENTTDVYINGFVKDVLGDKRINEILVQYIRDTYNDELLKKRIKDFCEEDEIYFAEWVEYEAEHKE